MYHAHIDKYLHILFSVNCDGNKKNIGGKLQDRIGEETLGLILDLFLVFRVCLMNWYLTYDVCHPRLTISSL